jgi:hypothetical protein
MFAELVTLPFHDILHFFFRSRKPKGRGTQKKKDKDAGNTSVADVTAAVPSDPSCSVTENVDLSLYKCYFRELDMEVFVALTKNLVLDKKDVKVNH